MHKKTQAAENRYEAAAHRLAKGEKEADVYRALYPRSKNWKRANLYAAASKLAAKVMPRVQELQKLATADTITSILRRKQILSDIAEARPSDFVVTTKTGGVKIQYEQDSPRQYAVQSLKSHVEGKDEDEATVTELRLRDPIAAIAELNKMEGVYAPEKFEADITHSMIMKEPDPAPVRRKRITAGNAGKNKEV